MQYRSSGMMDLPPVVKNLLIINGLVFLLQISTEKSSFAEYIAYGQLLPLNSGYFRVWQPITYMFMHGGFSHIIFNMITLWMFGRILEIFGDLKGFCNFI
jgi:rhomboid-like protein